MQNQVHAQAAANAATAQSTATPAAMAPASQAPPAGGFRGAELASDLLSRLFRRLPLRLTLRLWKRCDRAGGAADEGTPVSALYPGVPQSGGGLHGRAGARPAAPCRGLFPRRSGHRGGFLRGPAAQGSSAGTANVRRRADRSGRRGDAVARAERRPAGRALPMGALARTHRQGAFQAGESRRHTLPLRRVERLLCAVAGCRHGVFLRLLRRPRTWIWTPPSRPNSTISAANCGSSRGTAFSTSAAAGVRW